jgi:hypothetical protein
MTMQSQPAPRVGIFSREELARVVADTVPADRQHAVVLSLDEDGTAVAVKMTLRERWEVEGAFRRDWSGDLNVGARVIYSW